MSQPALLTASVMGTKACEVAGKVGGLAAIANAVMDAVADYGIKEVAMPFAPNRMWELLNDNNVEI